MPRKMILVGAGLAGCLVVGSAGVAMATDGSPSPSSPASPSAKPTSDAQRATRLCGREPKVAARVEKRLTRLTGDASTRGSVAWLQARATKVRARDPQLAAIIDDRVKIRQSLIPTLKLRQDELGKVVTWCAAHGHPVGSS
jgi:hypothetical protein